MPQPIEIPGLNIPVRHEDLETQEFIWGDLQESLKEDGFIVSAGHRLVAALQFCRDLKQITKAEVERIFDTSSDYVQTEQKTGIACVSIENALIRHTHGDPEAFQEWLEIASFAAGKIEPNEYYKTSAIWKEYVEVLLRELSKIVVTGSRPHEILEELKSKAKDISGGTHDLTKESF